jgi:tRNA(adenine34) deaminase
MAVGMNAEREHLMSRALDLAREAGDAGDHPYGTVLVTSLGTVAERNRVVSTNDLTAHSETMAIRAATAAWGLAAPSGGVLVTSYEPCPMCLGAILEAGIGELVIALRRPVGEPPLGDYSVEALLAMLGRTGELTITSGVLAARAEQFYAPVDAGAA